MTIRIRDYMTPTVYCIGSDQTLAKAHEMMRAHGIRHLPVLRGGELVGIVSNRDLYWIETLKDVDADEVLVEEAMTPVPYTTAPDAPLDRVAREMHERKYGTALVVSDRDLVGVFTTTDALRALADALGRRRTAKAS